MRPTFLPYALPSIGEAEVAEVTDTLRSGWLSTGPKVKQFEREFASYTGAGDAVAVSSCTAALHISLAALGIQPGDEVIVPTMTFCATANVVVHLGATPVILDVDEDGLLPADTVAAAITSRTKAIVPVHYAGQTCDMDEILEVAGARDIPVVEDAAHAVGCTYKGRKVGSIGRVTAFSFYATKNMTTGEGGMITTDDSKLAERMRHLSLHGMSRDAWNRYGPSGQWAYEVTAPGFKNNMSDIQAALGIHQLRRLDTFVARRQALAALYREKLAGVPGIKLPSERPDRNHVYHLFPIRVDESVAGCDRATLIGRLKDANIGTSVHFIPLHRHPFYSALAGRSGSRAHFSVADWLFEGLLSLPLYPAMEEADVADVCSALKSVLAVDRREHAHAQGS